MAARPVGSVAVAVAVCCIVKPVRCRVVPSHDGAVSVGVFANDILTTVPRLHLRLGVDLAEKSLPHIGDALLEGLFRWNTHLVCRRCSRRRRRRRSG